MLAQHTTNSTHCRYSYTVHFSLKKYMENGLNAEYDWQTHLCANIQTPK